MKLTRKELLKLFDEQKLELEKSENQNIFNQSKNAKIEKLITKKFELIEEVKKLEKSRDALLKEIDKIDKQLNSTSKLEV